MICPGERVFGGSALLGVAAHVLASLYITGPVVAERTMARDRILIRMLQRPVEHAAIATTPSKTTMKCRGRTPC